MDARLAEHVVRKWQSAKARALGSTHDVGQLPEVLPLSSEKTNCTPYKEGCITVMKRF